MRRVRLVLLLRKNKRMSMLFTFSRVGFGERGTVMGILMA